MKNESSRIVDVYLTDVHVSQIGGIAENVGVIRKPPVIESCINVSYTSSPEASRSILDYSFGTSSWTRQDIEDTSSNSNRESNLSANLKLSWVLIGYVENVVRYFKKAA